MKKKPINGLLGIVLGAFLFLMGFAHGLNKSMDDMLLVNVDEEITCCDEYKKEIAVVSKEKEYSKNDLLAYIRAARNEDTYLKDGRMNLNLVGLNEYMRKTPIEAKLSEERAQCLLPKKHGVESYFNEIRGPTLFVNTS